MKPVALKIQRRRFAREATWEIYVHHLVRKDGPCPEVISLEEYFLHDGHICMAYEKHGRSLESALKDGPLPLERVRRVTRQILTGLERLHQCGYAHSDVKPDNILYDPRTGDARLADLGSATDRFRQGGTFGTREYYAPEVIIGSPVGVEMDLWALGCTVFEMLTGKALFSPRRAARRKYKEFSRKAPPIELAESVAADEAEEKAEQLRRSEVVAEKYKLTQVLGSGRFGTVWSARLLHRKPLGGSHEPLWNHAQEVSSARPPATERDLLDRQWRHEKGADDLIDLALNYEHVLLIASLAGDVSPAQISAARYRNSFFESDGALRFRPTVRRTRINERLQRGTTLPPSARSGAADFLRQLLVIDPAARATAATALQHPWLESSR